MLGITTAYRPREGRHIPHVDYSCMPGGQFGANFLNFLERRQSGVRRISFLRGSVNKGEGKAKRRPNSQTP